MIPKEITYSKLVELLTEDKPVRCLTRIRRDDVIKAFSARYPTDVHEIKRIATSGNRHSYIRNCQGIPFRILSTPSHGDLYGVIDSYVLKQSCICK